VCVGGIAHSTRSRDRDTLVAGSRSGARRTDSATGCAARSPLPRCQNSPPDDRNPVRSNRRDPVANTPGRLVRKGFAYLLPRPRGSRMVGDIQMDDAAAVVRENDEDNRTRKVAVGTVKKSIEAHWERCVRRNVRQVGEGDAGRRPKYLATVVSAISIPNFWSSP